MARHVKQGDIVMVTAGNDRGRTGKVLRVIPADDKVVVEGVNVRKKHVKPSQANPQGGLERVEAPIHVSKVALEDPKTGKPTRVGFRIENGQKVRVAKRSGEVING